MNSSWVTARKRSLSETLKDSSEKRLVSGTALISHFLSLHFFNLGQLLTFKKGTSYNRAALQNSPWGTYKPERVWESNFVGSRPTVIIQRSAKRKKSSCQMLPRALPARLPMNFKKQSLYEDQTGQAIGRAGEQCQSQDGETIGYVLLIKPT